MKKNIADFMSRFLVCQQVKVEHQKPFRTLHPLPFLEWKWEHITMNFVVGLPRTQAGYDAIWMIVDRLTKSVYFLAIQNNLFLDKLGKLYINEIVKLHRVPVSIVSDRDLRFKSRFWPKL